MFSCPTALTKKSAVIVYSGQNSLSFAPITLTSTFHFFSASSHRASSTALLNRICLYRLHFSATPRRYVRISSCPGYSRVQSGFCSKEKLYRFDHTSQQQPGYLLSYQVPPMPEDFSRMTKFWQELRLMRSIAVQRPKRWC